MNYKAEITNRLNEFNDFNKILLGNHYKYCDVQKIINELFNNIHDEQIFINTIKCYNVIKIYLSYVDIQKFINISWTWNIHQININISDLLVEQLSKRINDKQLIHKIVYEYLKDLIINIEYAMKNFDKILTNIEKHWNIKKCKFNEVSKYKLININDKVEMEHRFELIMNDLFYILKNLVSSSTYHRELLNNRYCKNLILFIQKYLPYQFYPKIIAIAECVNMYLKCIDLKQIIERTEKMNVPSSIEFDLKRFILNNLISKNLKADENAFVKSILNKLDNVFQCVDFILLNPRNIINNAKVFIELDVNDDIF